MNKLLKYGTMVLAIVFVLVSCDTDPTELGSDFLGIDIDGTIVQQDFEAKAFSAPLNPVQTNNFPSVQLGTYTDPIYGETKYEFLAQLNLSSPGIDFGIDPVLDSVVLEIPYFSTRVGVNGEEALYSLDSVYGSGAIDIKIFENEYFLANFDSNDVDQIATYYSDFGEVLTGNIGAEILPLADANGSSDLTGFKPSAEEVRLETTNQENIVQVTGRKSPRLRQRLEPTYWENKIINLGAGDSRLASNSNFQNYFRGLYFQAIKRPLEEGVLTYMNLNDAVITLHYNSTYVDVSDLDGDGDTQDTFELSSTFELNMRGSRVVLTESDVPQEIQTAIDNSYNPANGSDRLYVKGGEAGAITFIDLFGPDADADGEADALTLLRSKNVLVNEANLEFYVDQLKVPSGSTEPERILIYDFVTGRYLADFELSGSGINSNISHLGRLEISNNGDRKYKIRLTNHISQVLAGNTSNNRLALVVSQNVSLLGNSKVKQQTQPLKVEALPISAAISHEGTILHGNLSEDPTKRLKLKVFYTEPN